MAKTPEKKKTATRRPTDLTGYSLRGLRNDIADLTARIEQLEQLAQRVHGEQLPDPA